MIDVLTLSASEGQGDQYYPSSSKFQRKDNSEETVNAMYLFEHIAAREWT